MPMHRDLLYEFGQSHCCVSLLFLDIVAAVVPRLIFVQKAASQCFLLSGLRHHDPTEMKVTMNYVEE